MPEVRSRNASGAWAPSVDALTSSAYLRASIVTYPRRSWGRGHGEPAAGRERADVDGDQDAVRRPRLQWERQSLAHTPVTQLLLDVHNNLLDGFAPVGIDRIRIEFDRFAASWGRVQPAPKESLVLVRPIEAHFDHPK